MSGALKPKLHPSRLEKEKGQVRTRDLWAGIRRTQDVVKCMTQNEHIKRVFTRENTPYIMHGIVPSFEKRKDPFVQILLNQVQRENEIIKQAKKEREKMVQETQEAKDLINQTQNSQNYNQKLKQHFDSYIKALALNKQLEEKTNEKSILNQYYKDKNKSDSKIVLALENDIISSNINNQQDAGKSYFITQKDKFM